ncbi:hypothetical protein D0Y65_034325 [Glycine soja]|uniref:J domain-containing protein n=2 Tax=Glycine subgen. Soja TaxID=1462606 RepID=I1LSS4_SOYBN|nr:hypothetical protein D0Y65_034325 [Glycine soja]
MLLDKNDIQETHYEVLHVKEHANYEEIRAGYRSVVLSLHPDRLLKTSKTSSSNQTTREISQNLSLRKDVLAADVAEDLSLQDMMIEDDGEALELFYQCRCGDYFSVDSWN